jgi:protein-serine/threonine kinase
MQQLLCEPEDRLGSQASTSVSRPNSMVVQARRSGFMAQGGSTDGANFIKGFYFCLIFSTICLTFPEDPSVFQRH